MIKQEMESTRQKLEDIFEAALALENPEKRASFLNQACSGNAALRLRVEKLLAAHTQSRQFFDECHSAVAEVFPDSSTAVRDEIQNGGHIGPYKLLQKIGEGGCGVVYMAEQEQPMRRRVALKIIKLGMDTKGVIARFEAERQALALMDHDNIARVLEAGTTETWRPYFVMELVHGIRITEYCDKNKLDAKRRLKLFIQVCHAIQHAHQKGIIHRDIKPSNILVTMLDGALAPKVIDFGIAKAIEEKLTDKTLFTVSGHFVGTPAYMSPEQADFNGLDIDTRTDVYSLGVLLYELLTGKTPFDQEELLASGLDAMRKTLREREPRRPSARLEAMNSNELALIAQRRQLDPPKLKLLLRGDLDWVVMKALEKDRRRRYETANGLAMDVQRFLDREPVLARPPSRRYRFQKLVQRNRAVFAAAGAVMLALLLGLGTATWMFFKERAMRHRAVMAEQMAEQAQMNEAELRRQAETREKIAQALLLLSQGKFQDADALVAKAVFTQPTLDGTSLLRTLGEWHALHGRPQLAADRLLQAVQVDQLDEKPTVAQDFIEAAAALTAARDTNRFAIFCQLVNLRLAAEPDSDLAVPLLRAKLYLPKIAGSPGLLTPVMPPIPRGDFSCVGSSVSTNGASIIPLLKLENIASSKPCSLDESGGTLTFKAGGADIWTTNDGFAYACMLMAGDFDYRMRVCSMTPSINPFTRTGLMARESANQPTSRHVTVAVNEGDTFQVVARSAEGALADSVPHDPLPTDYGSNSWVRLQRVGAIFHAYTSSNGLDWIQLYQTTGGDRPFSDPIYFGIATCAHDPEKVVTSVIGDFGATPTLSVNAALTQTLLHFRRGEMQPCMTWCLRLLAYPDCDLATMTSARLILAMAENQLLHNDDSRDQFSQAKGELDQNNGDLSYRGNTEAGYWYEWDLANELFIEAQTAIK